MAHAGGRPVKYETVEELQVLIDDYFTYCDNRIKTIFDEKTNSEIAITNPAPYTMHGLARWLGLSRQGLMEYKGKPQFSDAIKQARERVAEDVETRLMDGRAQAGAIFNLKNNFGWKDQKETDITSGGKPIPLLGANVPVHDSTEETPETK